MREYRKKSCVALWMFLTKMVFRKRSGRYKIVREKMDRRENKGGRSKGKNGISEPLRAEVYVFKRKLVMPIDNFTIMLCSLYYLGTIKQFINLFDSCCILTTYLIIYVTYFYFFQCMFQSWYLSVDTQLFFVAPFFIYSLWKWRKFGPICLSVALIVSLIIPAVVTYKDNLDPTLLFYAK